MVKSAERVIKIFEFFAERQAPAQMLEISRALKLPQSSTSILLRSLVQQDYLSFDAQRRSFMPTLRVAMLGSWFQHNLLAGAGLVTQLEALNQSLGECVVLGMRNGLHVQFVHVMQSLEPVRYYIRPGANRPLLQSALGKMILSRMPDEEIRRLVLRYNNERSKDMPAFETRVLLKEISVAREQGFFETRNLMSSGIGMIAMLIPFNISNRAVGLGIGAPVDRLEAKRKMILNMMREAIAVLSLQNNNVCEAAKVIEAPRTHSNDKSRARKKRLRP